MNVDALVKRAFLSLEDGEFDKAGELLDQALNENPENAIAYVGLLCAELNVHSESELENYSFPISELNNFKKAIRFGEASLTERLNQYNANIILRLDSEEKERNYLSALDLMNQANAMPEINQEQCLQKSAAFSKAADALRNMNDYKDASENAKKCDRSIETSKALAEKRKNEAMEAKVQNKKQILKTIKISLISVVSIIVVISGSIAFSQYYASLPTKYSSAYQEARNHGAFDEAQKLYEKYLRYYYSGDVLTQALDRQNSKDTPDYTNKKELIKYESGIFAKTCEEMKLSLEALEYIAAGKIQEGNTIYDNADNNASLAKVPYVPGKDLLIKILTELNPISIQADIYALYWLNTDGTIGRIGGISDVDNWTDIEKIEIYNNYIGGMKKDGSVLYSKKGETNTMTVAPGAVSFDFKYGVLASVNSDGTVTYSSYSKTDDLSGLEKVKMWTNMKSVRVVKAKVKRQSVVGEGTDSAKINTTELEVPCIIAKTSDGKELISAYNTEATLSDKRVATGGRAYINPYNGSLELPSTVRKNMASYKFNTVNKENLIFEETLNTNVKFYSHSMSIQKDSDGAWSVY